MSQIQSFASSMGPAGPILTLTGDDLVAVSPGAGNINVLANNQQGSFGIGQFTGTVAANTLSFEPLVDVLTTNDGLFHTIFSQLLPTNSALILRAHVIGLKNDFTVYAAGMITGGARRQGANPATSVGAGALLESDYIGVDPTPAVRIDTAGNSIIVQVRGVPGDTYNWTSQILYQFVE